MGTIHNPVWGLRSPVSMVSFPNWMVTSLLSKNAVHPSLQSCPMESSDSECRFGKRWIMRAVMGMFGMSIVAWAVEVSISPFGMATSMVESSVFAF